MTVEPKVSAAMQYADVFKAIIESDANISAVLKFKLLGKLKELEPICANAERIRVELIGKYGQQMEDGGVGIVEPTRDKFESDEEFTEAVADFQKKVEGFRDEYTAVLESDSGIKIESIKAADVMNANIPTEMLLAIYDLIEE